MRRYTQLTQDQRYQIQALMKAGLNQTETALIVVFISLRSAVNSNVIQACVVPTKASPQAIWNRSVKVESYLLTWLAKLSYFTGLMLPRYELRRRGSINPLM